MVEEVKDERAGRRVFYGGNLPGSAVPRYGTVEYILQYPDGVEMIRANLDVVNVESRKEFFALMHPGDPEFVPGDHVRYDCDRLVLQGVVWQLLVFNGNLCVVVQCEDGQTLGWPPALLTKI